MKKFLAWLKSLFTAPPLPPRVIVHPEPVPIEIPPNATLSQRAYAIAKGELGVMETDGDDDNARILEYDAATDLPKSMYSDETAWCSAFHNFCMQKAGGNGTRDAMARSWLNWGKKITEPQEGDTVIFSSPARGPEAGHVAFFAGRLTPGFIRVLGGNQNNSVCYDTYPTALVLGYRRSTDG